MKPKKKIIYTIIAVIVAILVFVFLNLNRNVSNEEVKLSYLGDSLELNFNPQKQPGYNNFLVNLNANLAIFAKDGSTKEYAAQKISMAKDNKSVDIELKKGLKYENGDEITAKDYLEGIKLLANPKTKSFNAGWALDNIVGAKEYANNTKSTIDGVKIKNKLNFTISLTKPLHYFKDMLVAINFSPVSKRFLDKVGVENYGVGQKNFLSSGPLKIEKYVKDQSISYVRNEKSILASNVKIKNVKIKLVSSEVAQTQMFKTNQLDSIIRSENSDKIIGKQLKNYHIENQETPFMFYLGLNYQTVDKNLAKALNLIIDKNYINKVFLNNAHKVRSVVTPNNYKKLDKELKNIGIDPNANVYNLELAKKIPVNTNKKYVLWDDSTVKDTILKYIKNQALKIGIIIEIQKVPGIMVEKEMYKKYGERKYDLVATSAGQDYSNPSSFLDTMFNSNSEINLPNYGNVDFDELLNKAINAPNEKAENEFYAQATKKLKDDDAIIVLYQRVKQYLIRKGKYQTDVIGRMGVINNWELVK